tara:strand:+ start:235 stop:1350 length:1116 start_codon:yes stop_codon:yes gene_type:complete
MKPYNYIYNIIDNIIEENINTGYCYLCFAENIRFSKSEAESYARRQYPNYRTLFSKYEIKIKQDYTYSNNEWVNTRNCSGELYNLEQKHHIIEHCWEPIWYKLDDIFWKEFTVVQQEHQIKHTVIHSEHNSWDIQQLEEQGIKTVHWFAHAYLCSEFYFKHYQKLKMVTNYLARPIHYPWLCTNRLLRQHRTDFLEMLDLSQGCYSLLNPDPNGLTYTGPVPAHSFDCHENHSAEIIIDDLTPWNTSFLHVVNETVWQDKIHFTEKIFKPVVLHQPFVVLQAPGSLAYLRSYGFKTFDNWWDESYDTIQDPTERMQAIADIVNNIGAKSLEELEIMRMEMASVLEHNFRHFYEKLPAICLDELGIGLSLTD